MSDQNVTKARRNGAGLSLLLGLTLLLLLMAMWLALSIETTTFWTSNNMANLLRQGAGVIMVSSYLPEVYELADTLHVFRNGTIVATHALKSASHETILTEAIGV